VKKRSGYALAVLFAINAINFFDRQIGGALGEPIRKEWGLSDGALGALNTSFTLLYAFVGIPLGRLSDRISRKKILTVAILVWSALTSASAITRNFWQMFATRLGVGAGEAACAPAATSLIGDLFPPSRRARAMSAFMLGLPIGIALSYLVSSFIAHAYGWRAAFLVAGIPGVICAIAAFFIDEPERAARVETQRAPFRTILSIPTVWWLIASGALHNFNMYALGSFLAPMLMRYHGASLRQAGVVAMVVFGLSGVPGLLIGGALADRLSLRCRDGRLLVGAFAILISIPLLVAALGTPPHAIATFAILAGAGVMAMYVYYSSVYATLHDVVEPPLRGTAMAVYFFAMYVLGASFGPVATGMTSDFFTRRAAGPGISGHALEPFRGAGLHSAMYLIPILGTLLTVVLLAATRSVSRDMDRVQSLGRM
jgi:predicted MFS family arabinose efflux permease